MITPQPKIKISTGTNTAQKIVNLSAFIDPTTEIFTVVENLSPNGQRQHFNLRVFDSSGNHLNIASAIVHKDPDDSTEWDLDVKLG